MTRATLIRVLLAVALATATGVEGRAQFRPPNTPPTTPPTTPPPTTTTTPPTMPGAPPSDSNRTNPWLIVSGVVIGILGLVIAKNLLSDPGTSNPPSLPPRFPPDQPPLTQLPMDPLPRQGSSGPGGGGPGAGGPGGSGATAQLLRSGFNLPAAGAPHVLNEVMLDVPASVPTATLDLIAGRHAMTRLETFTLRLTGRTLHRWRLDGGGSVADMIRNLAGERLVAGAQAIFIFKFAQSEPTPMNGEQYAPQKLNLPEAHRLATGNRVVIAVIDSEVDAAHPDLAGAVTASFNTSPDKEKPHAHGTGMAGAIAARRTVLGTAPGAGLVTVNAFSTRASEAEGTTFNILKGLDWAAERGARIVNMSFAGPSDPRLRDALGKANRKGMVLIAAAGNAGPSSPPLFPAADPNVIAVTATDIDDALFSGANRGNHIAVAAPGVDVLVPAPEGAYQFTTGTSVAAAEVSGVVALMLERNPSLTPADVRRILMSTAKDLGPKGRDPGYGAGLVNALKAVTSAGSGRPHAGIAVREVAAAR